MSDGATGGAMSAGRLLREAREAKGLQIGALASAIKVTPRKLEMLEADRFDQLLDPTFARALAQTVCRALKIDAAPVLALLPRPNASRLGEAGRDLNAPFHEPAGPLADGDWSVLGRPAIWAPLVLLIIAGAVYFLPHDWLESGPARRFFQSDRVANPGPAASAMVVTERPVAALGGAAVDAPPAAPTTSDAPAAPEVPAPAIVSTAPASGDATPAQEGVAAPAPAKLLQVRAKAPSWVEVVDGRGQSLLSRTIQPGEDVELDGTAPLKIRIGNAAATAIVVRGQPFDLAPYTRDNLVRLELK
jgi:cytoskeleton protein RodZ